MILLYISDFYISSNEVGFFKSNTSCYIGKIQIRIGKNNRSENNKELEVYRKIENNFEVKTISIILPFNKIGNNSQSKHFWQLLTCINNV